MNIKHNSRIGVWGYGIVGKSAVEHFHSQGHRVSIMDQRTPTPQEKELFHQKNILFYPETNKNEFFNFHDYIFSSSGINIANDYPTHKNKWLHELDIFYHHFKKPIIAVTGSIGKTSMMHILSSLLKRAEKKICIGGNIGTATFDLIAQQNDVDYALLEVSSFQLERCASFAPQLALWTNLYPNHLDHHITEEDYLLAKYAIIKHQTKCQLSLIELSLKERIPAAPLGHTRSYFSLTKPDFTIFKNLTHNEQIYFLENNTVIRYAQNCYTPLIKLDDNLLSFSFLSNIILVAAVCDLLNLNQHILYQLPTTTTLPQHRLEKIATLNNIDFYNDSKSTTTTSTLTAVKKLCNRPLHLFLGGLSKGVDRSQLIAQLKTSVTRIYCFGKEADELYFYCRANNIAAEKCSNLTAAFDICVQNIKSNDIVLLSPAGSSYDLYNNFEERGQHFKNLVTNFLQEFKK